MKWIEAAITTRSEEIDALCEKLGAYDIGGICIEDEADFKRFLENNHQYWDYVDEDLEASMKGKSRITFYLPADGDGFDQLAHLRTALQGFKDAHAGKYGTLLMTLENLKDADWENNWKQFFHPINIGNSFVIKPSWEDCTPDGRKVLEIDPESSFGTGRHETTRLCLELLEKTDCNDADVLDMGCGSGILGIGAYLLGAKSITAVDIDENAVLITRKNAAVNGIPDGILTAYTGNVLDDSTLESTVRSKKYGVVCANIVADVLVMMMPLFRDVMAQGGEIILSGIIAPRKQKVLDALKDGFDVIEVREENDWVAILAKVR